MRPILAFVFFFVSQTVVSQSNNEIAWGSMNRKIKDFSFSNSLNDSISIEGNLLQYEKGDFHSAINPAFDFLYGYSNKSKLQYGLGFDWNQKYRKWTTAATFLAKSGQYMAYQKAFEEEHHLLPTTALTTGSDKISSYYASAHINFKASSIFDFELGYGRNFIGHGHRSLFLSDFGNASPYFKIQTTFWKLQYTNLFAAHENIFNVEGASDLYQKKYSATHFLEWKINEWISIGVFEAVIWSNKHGNFNRGYDVNYINPVIFYRPVEFSVGSPDNVIVGGQLSVKASNNHQFYSQLVFDEFLLDEIKADVKQLFEPGKDIQSGWWANKYGVQLGWKANALFNNPHFFAQLEYNMVRPYTYAHSNPTQSYSHFNLPLAHPLGANFHEIISKLSFTKNRWRMNAQLNYAYQGISSYGNNYGENIQYSNISREKDYENYIGKGNDLSRVKYINLSALYLLKNAWKTTLELGYIHRYESREQYSKREGMIYLRLKTNLFRQQFDF